MNCWKNKVSSLLYKNGQIGLVFFLFTIILLHLPSVIYGSVFLAPITGNEADYYSKFGAWFTAIGAIFTIINTIVVIYLMIYLYKKESEFTILPFISELHKQLLDIEITIKEEIKFFNDKQYDLYETLYVEGVKPSGYEDVYKKEVGNLAEIIPEVKKLYSLFLNFKDEVSSDELNDISIYREKMDLVNKVSEIIILRKPSSEYKNSFVDGSREDAEPVDMIEAAKTSSLVSIQHMNDLFEKG